MKRNWSSDELLEHFTILKNELDLVSGHQITGKLGFIISLKFFQMEAKFPIQKKEIPRIIIDFIARQYLFVN